MVVDDEPAACDHLKRTLLQAGHPQVHICAIANDTKTALLEIEQHQPDAVFLDIDMPGENAFQFLSRIAPFDFEVIFVTAYDAFAVKAFKLNAVDYILKPVSSEEISEALRRLREKMDFKRLLKYKNADYDELISLMTTHAKPQRILLKVQNNSVAVAFSDIYLVEAMGSYSKIYFDQGGKERNIVMSRSLSEYEELLPQGLFFRVHKSYLVNFLHSKGVTNGNGNSVIVNQTHHIPVSRRRYPLMIEFIKTHELAKR